MKHLPLRRDMDENTNVYTCLFELHQKQEPTVLLDSTRALIPQLTSLLPQLIACFGRAMRTPLEEKLFEGMSSILQNLASQHPEAFEATVNTCSVEERETIMQLFRKASA